MDIINDFFSNIPPWLSVSAKIVLIIVFSRILLFALKKLLKRMILKTKSSRAGTLYALLKSVVTYVITILAIFQILEQIIGVSPVTLLATAGVVGVALGIGAQSFIKDIINGFFILLDDQYSVGELVTLDSFAGYVEELGLRTTKLRNFEGDVFTIPNGAIINVTNHSRRPRSVLITVRVVHGTDIRFAIETLKRILKEAKQEVLAIRGEPSVMGVSDLDAIGMELMLLCPCKPGDQFTLRREILYRIKTGFDAAQIELAHNNIISENE